MTTVRQGFGYRIVWCALAGLLAGHSLQTAVVSQSWGHAITGLAWALLAVAWFLQPTVLARRFSDIIPNSAALGIGPPWLRARLGLIALGLLVLGLVVRTASGGSSSFRVERNSFIQRRPQRTDEPADASAATAAGRRWR
jgi:hypothetical protein